MSCRPSTIRSYLRAQFARVNGSSRMNCCQAARGRVGEVVRAVGDRFRPPSEEVNERAWRGEGWPVSLLCSRNARPLKGLVGRAQLETKRATLYRGKCELGGAIGDCGRPGLLGNETLPPRHARCTTRHRDRFAPAPGETVRIRLGCLRSREWRDASPFI